MKVLGHPLHIMLIHFPSALLPMEFVCYTLYYLNGDTTFGFSAFYAMTGAVVLGWAAVLFGALDLLKIPENKPAVLTKALLHGGINSSILIVYNIFAYSIFKNYPELPPAGELLLIAKALLVGLLVVGNYLGGSLVLKDKIGLEE